MKKKDYNWIEKTNEELLAKIYASFRVGLMNVKSADAKLFMQSLGLHYDKVPIAFNSGQHHHRQTPEYKTAYVRTGVLIESKAPTINGELGYRAFGHKSLIFPLKNEKEEIVNLYAMSISNGKVAYLNSSGIYPGFQKESTKRLFITYDILDAATILQANILDNQDNVIALHDGSIKGEMVLAIKKLKLLRHIIIAGNEKQLDPIKTEINKQFPELSIIRIPFEKTISAYFLKYGQSDLFGFIHSKLNGLNDAEKPPENTRSLPATVTMDTRGILNVTYNELCYQTSYGIYTVLNAININDNERLTVSLKVFFIENNKTERIRLDLLDWDKVKNFVGEVSSKLNLSYSTIEADFYSFTEELERYKKTEQDKFNKIHLRGQSMPIIPEERKTDCIGLLKSKTLLEDVNKMLGLCGIVGEENLRLLLFIAASTFKMPKPLHVLVQGSTASGKTYLLKRVGECMPMESIQSFTRVTNKSLYNFDESVLNEKLIIIEDYDGLSEEAEYAFRELQTSGKVISSTTVKNEYGHLTSVQKTVNGKFASMLATTRSEVYEDNMNRCLVVKVNESEEQTMEIINYYNKKQAGKINLAEEKRLQYYLADCIRLLFPYEVVNPFAESILLPRHAKKKRRLYEQVHSFISAITLLHQYQRQKDGYGRLVAEKEDVMLAIDLLFETILIKVDDLDASTREVFELIKKYVNVGQQSQTFKSRDLRLETQLSKATIARSLEELRSMEYISIAGGNRARGYEYRITFNDDFQKLKSGIQSVFSESNQQRDTAIEQG